MTKNSTQNVTHTHAHTWNILQQKQKRS